MTRRTGNRIEDLEEVLEEEPELEDQDRDAEARGKASGAISALETLHQSLLREDTSRRAAQDLAARVRNRDAQIRRLFVDRQPPGGYARESDKWGGPPTPLARLLRGGRGGRVRLTLYLSLLWVAANPPHDVTYPARAWATLLGLADPEGNGSRRINDAVTWLCEHRFIETTPRPGHPTTVILLDESGTGEPYQVPGAIMNQLRARPESNWSRHRYFKLPHTFWTNGWITTLSGPGVAMLLVMLLEASGLDPADEIWFSPTIAERRFSLSEDTRSAGLRELAEHRLITTHRRPTSADTFEFRRLRNTYTALLDRLNDPRRGVSRAGSDRQAD